MARDAMIHATKFEVLFDWRVGSVVGRIRIQRGLIDLCQGRRLDMTEAVTLVRRQSLAIRRVLIRSLRRSVHRRPAQVMDLRPALSAG